MQAQMIFRAHLHLGSMQVFMKIVLVLYYYPLGVSIKDLGFHCGDVFKLVLTFKKIGGVQMLENNMT